MQQCHTAWHNSQPQSVAVTTDIYLVKHVCHACEVSLWTDDAQCMSKTISYNFGIAVFKSKIEVSAKDCVVMCFCETLFESRHNA